VSKAVDTKRGIISVANAFYDAFNARDLERAREVIASDAKMIYMAGGDFIQGPAAVREMWQGWLTAFPDARVEVATMTVGENRIAVEFVGRGTHTGPLVIGNETIAPTGRRIELHYCDVHTIREGKIHELRVYVDEGVMFEQLEVARPT